MSMLAQCVHCLRLAPFVNAQVHSDHVALLCPICGKANRLEFTQPSGEEPVLHAAPVPKLHAVKDAPSPAGVLALVQQNTLEDALREKLEAMPAAEIHDQFIALFSNWHDDKAHAALLETAGAKDLLAALGQRYRTVLDVRGQDEMAESARDRILARAMATMQFSASPVRTASEWKKPALVGFTMVAFAGVGLLLARMLGAF